jgi:hypothetical protein
MKMIEAKIPPHWSSEEIEKHTTQYIQPALSLLPFKLPLLPPDQSDQTSNNETNDGVTSKWLNDDDDDVSDEKKSKEQRNGQIIMENETTNPNQPIETSTATMINSWHQHSFKHSNGLVCSDGELSNFNVKNTVATWILTTNELRFGTSSASRQHSTRFLLIIYMYIYTNICMSSLTPLKHNATST